MLTGFSSLVHKLVRISRPIRIRLAFDLWLNRSQRAPCVDIRCVYSLVSLDTGIPKKYVHTVWTLTGVDQFVYNA